MQLYRTSRCGFGAIEAAGGAGARRRRCRRPSAVKHGQVEPLEPRALLSGSWAGTDVGPVGAAGAAAVAPGGSVTVSGGGAGIGGSTDSFHFAWQPLVGNGTLVARVASPSNTSPSAQAGIMVRESLAADARYVDLVVTPGKGITFQDRLVSHNPPASATVPGGAGEWLRLVRQGSTFTGSVSRDGVNWAVVGRANVALVNNVCAGLCVSAGNNGALNRAAFTGAAVAGTGVSASPWVRAAADPDTRWESQSFTWQGRLYVFGGYTDRSLDATTDCDAYDPATNTWSFVTHMPSAVTHAATVVVGDTAYFVGGNIGRFTYASAPTTSRVLTFNLVSRTWGAAPSLPVPTAAGGVVNIGSYLYFYGGISAGIARDYSYTWALNLNNPSAGWTARAPMPDARNHLGYVAVNGTAYAVGGNYLYNESAGNVAEVDAYNPLTNTWKRVASLPVPWSSVHCDTLAVGGRIVIVGGQTNGGFGGIYLTNVEAFNPATNAWSQIASLPEPNEGQSAAFINNELIVVDGTVDNLGGWAQDETLIDNSIALGGTPATAPPPSGPPPGPTGATGPTGSISGTVFNDADGDGAQGIGEAGLAGVPVYLDLGNLGTYVAGDPVTTTDAAGAYRFTGLAAGTYIVRQARPPGTLQTTPANGYGRHVTVFAGQAASGQNFGDRA